MPDCNGSHLRDDDYGKLIYEWEIHPIKKDKKKLILFLIVTIVFFLFVLEITENLILAYLIFLIYLFTLKSFIFKTYYKLFENGLFVVQLGFNDKRAYKNFIALFESKDSILLSTMKDYSFIAKTRGIELIIPDQELKEKIRHFLEEKIAEP